MRRWQVKGTQNRWEEKPSRERVLRSQERVARAWHMEGLKKGEVAGAWHANASGTDCAGEDSKG